MAGSEELLARLSGALPRHQSDRDDEAAATRIEDDGNDREKEAMTTVVSRCEGVLAEAKSLLDPSSEAGQELLDSVGLELPCILLRYLPISEACRDMSVSIMKTLIDFCSPRDMFVVYMEALQMFSEPATLDVCPYILEGLGKIFTRIRKRRVGFFQESMSGLLRVAKVAMEADLHVWPVFDKLTCLVMTLYEINTHEQVEEQKERMSQTLGAFVFLLLARAADHEHIEGWKSAVRQVVDLLPYCGFSYTDLLTGRFLQDDIDLMNRECCCEDFSMVEIRKGALFAVSWKLCMGEAADKHKIHESLRLRLSCSRCVLVEILCNCRILLNPQESSWKLVKHGVSLLDALLGLWSSPVKHASEVSETECSETPKLMSMLQVLQNIIIYCPNASARQQAYNCFVKILTEVLSPLERYDTFKTLIMNCGHSSMVSLLFYLVKEEVGKGIDLRKCGIEAEQKPESPFAKEGVLDLVEYVLRPPFGGPPHLPEQIDAVLSVLNFYRFILIKESSGKTNYTGVLSKNNLQKAYNLWFLPLRGIVEASQSSTTQHDNGGNDDINACILLALTNLAGVLYRCIELVEGAL